MAAAPAAAAGQRPRAGGSRRRAGRRRPRGRLRLGALGIQQAPQPRADVAVGIVDAGQMPVHRGGLSAPPALLQLRAEGVKIARERVSLALRPLSSAKRCSKLSRSRAVSGPGRAVLGAGTAGAVEARGPLEIGRPAAGERRPASHAHRLKLTFPRSKVEPQEAKAQDCSDQPIFSHAINIIHPPKPTSIGDRAPQAAMLSSQNSVPAGTMAKLKEVFVCQILRRLLAKMARSVPGMR